MLKWISKSMNQKGFTLIELVVVIAILGILAAIAMPKLSQSRLSAQVGAHNTNVRSLYSTALMWIADNPDQALASTDSEAQLTKYLQKYPTVPALVNSKLGAADTYTVDIQEDGTITVTPNPYKADQKAENGFVEDKEFYGGN